MAWHASGQKLRYGSKLLESREPLRGCSHEACPELVRTDCTAWLLEVQQSLPSATFAATADGAPATSLKVSVDGTTVEASVPLELDPGQHSMRFEIPGFAPVEKTVVLRNGDKNQVLSHAFTSPPKARPTRPEPATERPIHPLTWVLGGVSLAGAGVATGFWLSARSDYDDLEKSCAPLCGSERTDPTKQKLLISDIGLGVAVAAGIGAVVVHLMRPEVSVARPEDRAAQNTGKRTGGLKLEVRASSNAGLVSVGGTL